MSIETLRMRLPEYAKDLKLNLSSLIREGVLTDQQLWGTLVASAVASRGKDTLAAIEAEAAQHLSEAALTAAHAAAAIMSMNNVYYRFVHITKEDAYRSMPAKLRMNVIANPGIDKADFELWSLAVSAINGCGMCIDAHEHELRKAGVGREAIQAAVRIASVVHAVAVVIEADTGPSAIQKDAA